MKTMINIRNSVIIVLCVTIVFMGIGFIVLSMKLEDKINDVGKFDVSFTNVTKDSSTKGGTINPSGNVEISEEGKELDMSFILNTAHDEISYSVTIKNEGTLDAVIVDLMESPDYDDSKFNSMIDPVTITYNDVIGKELKPGEEVVLKLTVFYNPSTIVGTRNFNYKLGLVTKSVE